MVGLTHTSQNHSRRFSRLRSSINRFGRLMNILGLGISAFYHDSAACLIQDGKIIAAAQEERFTRKKHDFSFPKNALRYCLEERGLKGSDLDLVAFYDKPFIKFERIMETYLACCKFSDYRLQ